MSKQEFPKVVLNNDHSVVVHVTNEKIVSADDYITFTRYIATKDRIKGKALYDQFHELCKKDNINYIVFEIIGMLPVFYDMIEDSLLPAKIDMIAINIGELYKKFELYIQELKSKFPKYELDKNKVYRSYNDDKINNVLFSMTKDKYIVFYKDILMRDNVVCDALQVELDKAYGPVQGANMLNFKLDPIDEKDNISLHNSNNNINDASNFIEYSEFIKLIKDSAKKPITKSKE